MSEHEHSDTDIQGAVERSREPTTIATPDGQEVLTHLPSSYTVVPEQPAPDPPAPE